MTVIRPQRTDLATVICIFEFCAGFVPIAGLFLLAIARQRMLIDHPNGALPPTSPMLGIATVFSAGLTFAATLTLWQMRGASFYLFAVKLAISLFQYLRILFRNPTPVIGHSSWPQIITPDQIHTITLLSGLFGVVFLGATTWYVYVVTQPKVAQEEPLESTC